MRRMRATGLVIALFVFPASAWGGCRDRDLEGTYALTAESTGVYGTITTTCEIAVNRDGKVRSGAACRQRDRDGLEAEARLDGGEMSVSRSCRVTGQVMIDGYPSVITEARMSGDKNKVTGKGTNAVDGSPLTFTATRQDVDDDDEEEKPRHRGKKKRWWNWF